MIKYIFIYIFMFYNFGMVLKGIFFCKIFGIVDFIWMFLDSEWFFCGNCKLDLFLIMLLNIFKKMFYLVFFKVS